MPCILENCRTFGYGDFWENAQLRIQIDLRAMKLAKYLVMINSLFKCQASEDVLVYPLCYINPKGKSEFICISNIFCEHKI